MLCGKGFYSILARKAVYGNTSTIPRPVHKIKNKEGIYVLLLFHLSYADIKKRQTLKKNPLKIHQLFLIRATKFKINFHISHFISHLDFE